MTESPLRVGIIGFGYIGKIHAHCYQSIPHCFSEPKVQAQVAAVLRSGLGRDAEILHSLGSPLETTSMEEFLAQDLDMVDICSPNGLHHDQIQAALEKRHPIYCEKPLGLNLDQARDSTQAANKAGVLTHTAFTMRYIPAVQQAKAILAAGALGEINNFRIHYFHNSYMDPARPMSWRLQKATSGGGSLTDLGIHMIDMVRYLLGDVDWVKCRTRTFITQRPIAAGSAEMAPVDVDDWALCMLGLKNGAEGVIEVTRMSGGMGDSCRIEIFGSQGSIEVDFSQTGSVRYYDQRRKQYQLGSQGFPTPAGERPMSEWLPQPKLTLGWFKDAHLGSIYDFLLNIRERKESSANFEAALKAQELLEAAYLSASRNTGQIYLPLP
ncbi:MAG: Gfo/Idh/MocA family oxidoreductase [Pelolinea sp.]|nr:Gfo/Idh/MocA family oxidoreductase [Pelolinea sp.]